MKPDEVAENCNAINGLQSALPPTGLDLDVCGGGQCATRRATGPAPPKIRTAKATLTQGGRTVATGTVSRGRIAITPKAPVQAGDYTLTFTQTSKRRHDDRYRLKAPKGRRLTQDERRMRRWEHRHVHTQIPITIP
jgi:hypothetical protein